MQRRTHQGCDFFEPTREPFLSGPHQDGMGRHKAIPNREGRHDGDPRCREGNAQMTDISNFKRLSLAAAIVVSAFG
ncbi:MAG: hypothetical protein E5W13_33510, partial [Mesorhizobium sp.]